MNAFDRIIGYASEKEEMMRLCDVLKNSDKYLKLGVKIPKAVLLYGEPGLGKTLMAKAFIAETGRQVFHCKKNKSNGGFVNEIKATFENAIKNAPSIIFFDDMDKFAEDNLQRNCNKEEFVSIQTGLEDIVDQDVFVIATANDILYLPDSLMREGRFGKQIKFSPPSFEDSVKIIQHFLSEKHMTVEVTAETLAFILSEKSCAMLESVINEAGIYAAYSGRRKIIRDDIKNAVSNVLLKRNSRQNIEDETKRRIAYHEAGHALLSILTKKSVGCLAIGECGQDGIGVGVCSCMPLSALPTLKELENKIMMLLAGKAAVEIKFGEIDVGAKKDLFAAMDMVSDLMENLAANGFEHLYLQDAYCAMQAMNQIDKNQEKKNRVLEALYIRTKTLLVENNDFFDELAQNLFEQGILLYDEINEMAKKHRY